MRHYCSFILSLLSINNMKKYSLSELERMGTVCVGQADDLKFDDGRTRVWLSRCTIPDGEPYDNKVTVEELIKGMWKVVDTYPAHR